jgi:hypothetical protein
VPRCGGATSAVLEVNIGIAVTQGNFAEDSDVSIGRNNFED